jgi:uncharacterized phage infection (PIP) family protein YhgE
MTLNQNSNQNNLPKNKPWIWIVSVFAVFSAIAVYGVYRYYLLPEQVKNAHNKNIEIVNQRLRQSKSFGENFPKISDGFQKTVNDTSNPEATKQFIAELNNLKASQLTIINQTDQLCASLDRGVNDDTAKFAEFVCQTIRAYSDRDALVVKIIDAFGCWAEVDLAALKPTSQLDTLFKEVGSKVKDFDDLANFYEQLKEPIIQTKNLIKSQVDCFRPVDNLTDQQLLANQQNLATAFDDFVSSLDRLTTLAKKKDVAGVDTEQNKLDKAKGRIDNLTQIYEQSLVKTLENITSKVKDQLEETENISNQVTSESNKLRDKYGLQYADQDQK